MSDDGDTMTICRECCTLLDGPEAGSCVRWTTCDKCASNVAAVPSQGPAGVNDPPDKLRQFWLIAGPREIERLREENARYRTWLSEAAAEINCAGPIAHRIRVLRSEHQAEIQSLRDRITELQQALGQ